MRRYLWWTAVGALIGFSVIGTARALVGINGVDGALVGAVAVAVVAVLFVGLLGDHKKD